MPIVLDHLLVPVSDRHAAAQLLAHILGVPWVAQGAVGPFTQVFLSADCTLDFDQWDEPIPKMHYCFRVPDAEFGQILGRLLAADIPFRSTPHGASDSLVNDVFGGRLLYWDMPDGHTWEILTVSYARQSMQTEGVPET